MVSRSLRTSEWDHEINDQHLITAFDAFFKSGNLARATNFSINMADLNPKVGHTPVLTETDRYNAHPTPVLAQSSGDLGFIIEVDLFIALPGYLAWGTSMHNVPRFMSFDVIEESHTGQRASQVLPLEGYMAWGVGMRDPPFFISFDTDGFGPSGQGNLYDSLIDPCMLAPPQYIEYGASSQTVGNVGNDSQIVDSVYNDKTHIPTIVPILLKSWNERNNVATEIYDPLWIQKANVDPAVVDNYFSAMKFEELVCKRVVKPTDEFVVQVTYLNNDRSFAKGTITLKPVGSSIKPNTRGRHMDFEVFFSARPQFRRLIQSCPGVKVMAETIRSYDFGIQDLSATFLTNHLHVMREGQSLGSIGYVRKAYQMWRDQLDKIAEQTGQTWRTRRRKVFVDNPSAGSGPSHD